MAHLFPFRAWRPKDSMVSKVACVPYDVIDSEEARELAKGNPNSFLHVIRPEIDLPETLSIYSDEVYQKGKSNLTSLLNSDAFIQEEEPTLYVYRLIMEGRTQTGIFGCVSVDDYDNDVILKHELTRPDKEDDRTKHILTQEAHSEPVMLTYKDDERVQSVIENTLTTDPLYDFEATDGVRHTLWKVAHSDNLARLFESIDHLYVADGHHRCKSASRVAEELQAQGNSSVEARRFPAVLFPMSSMKILSYNRIIYSVPEDFWDRLTELFPLRSNASSHPDRPGQISLLGTQGWYGMTLPDSNSSSVSDQLDVARVSEFILRPLLNIENPRTDKNIAFVGGIRGTRELDRLVRSGKADLAISMYPTSIEELVAVSDAGELMPPKSTWFEPKLRSGLLIHTF